MLLAKSTKNLIFLGNCHCWTYTFFVLSEVQNHLLLQLNQNSVILTNITVVHSINNTFVVSTNLFQESGWIPIHYHLVVLCTILFDVLWETDNVFRHILLECYRNISKLYPLNFGPVLSLQVNALEAEMLCSQGHHMMKKNTGTTLLHVTHHAMLENDTFIGSCQIMANIAWWP